MTFKDIAKELGTAFKESAKGMGELVSMKKVWVVVNPSNRRIVKVYRTKKAAKNYAKGTKYEVHKTYRTPGDIREIRNK